MSPSSKRPDEKNDQYAGVIFTIQQIGIMTKNVVSARVVMVKAVELKMSVDTGSTCTGLVGVL